MEEKRIKYKGISYDKSRETKKKWRVRVTYNNKTYYVGRFEKQENAIEARENFINKLKDTIKL